MIKKENSNKGSKTGGSQKNEDKSRDRNTYSQKQLPETRDITQISYLERRLNEQIKARQKGQTKLLQMIKYLQQTKKSKIPAQFQKLSSRKFLSPNRNTLTTLENQQITNFKAQIAVLNSQRQLHEQQSNRYINRVKQQLQEIKQKYGQMQQFKQEYLQFVTSIKEQQIDAAQREQGFKQSILRELQQIKKNFGIINQQISQKATIDELKNYIYQDQSIKLIQEEVEGLKLAFDQMSGLNVLVNQVEKLKISVKEIQKLRVLPQEIQSLKTDFKQISQLKKLQEEVEILQMGLREVQKMKAAVAEIPKLKVAIIQLKGLGQGLSEVSYKVQQILQGFKSTDSIVSKMDQILMDLVVKVEQQFGGLQRKVQNCNKLIQQTKCIAERAIPQPLTFPAQQLANMSVIIQSLQRRLDLLYNEYLSSSSLRKY